MKKIICSILSIAFWFFWFTFAGLEFTNYQVLWQIQKDGTIDVQENIDAYFSSQMHGIERNIPLKYTVQDTKFQVFLDNINVPDYNYKIMDNYDETVIRIWDADILVEWEKKYEIDYSIYWLIKNFSGMWYSELYRNVIWYDRSNSIKNVQIELTLPKTYTWLTKDDFLITAWYSKKTSIDDFEWEVRRDENKIYITYDKRLYSHNWITLSVRFPNDYFDFDHSKQESLLVWYTHDFNIKNYKLYWVVEKNWNIKFQNDVELEILNKGRNTRAELPYRYIADLKDYLTQLSSVEINWEKKNISKYDTTNLSSTFLVPWKFTWDTTISGNYSIYGLIRPFSWEYENRAYRLYIPLPTMNLYEDIENLEITLDVPWGCETLYKEDISVNAYWKIVWIDEYNEKYWNIWCRGDKFMMTLSGDLAQGNKFGLYINFVEWTFDLDEDLLQALASAIDWEAYYTDKINRQSILFAIWILLFWWWFKALMNRRYKNQSMMGNKYPIYFDAPKWVDSPEAWVLVDNRIDPKDLTALIYQWAVNHYIKIYAEKDNWKKYYIKKLKQLPWTSKKYQLNLFNSLFKDWTEFHFSETSNLRSTLYKAKVELEDYIRKEEWFKHSFFSWIWWWFRLKTGCLVFAVAFLWFIPYFAVVSILNNHLIPVSNWVSIPCFIAFILIITSYRNYKEETNTEKWKEVRNHCLWFKDFLVKVDKVKLEILLKENPLYIEKALPYAIVFGVDSEFIKNITPEMIEEWKWFEWDSDYFSDTIRYINTYNTVHLSPIFSSSGSSSSSSWHSSSYSSSWWFSSGSSFGWWFHSWWGGGGGWWGWW